MLAFGIAVITFLPSRASVARSAAGRPARKTAGFARAEMNGTPLTPEVSAHPACTNGLRHSASLAADGRRIRIGMRPVDLGVSSTLRTEPETATHKPRMNGGKRVLRAVPSRLDDIIFELAQHGKLLVKLAYRLWVGERVATP